MGDSFYLYIYNFDSVLHKYRDYCISDGAMCRVSVSYQSPAPPSPHRPGVKSRLVYVPSICIHICAQKHTAFCVRLILSSLSWYTYHVSQKFHSFSGFFHGKTNKSVNLENCPISADEIIDTSVIN